MAYPRTAPLGIAPLVVAEIVKDGPSILNAIAKLFGENGSYDETHAAILRWVQVILADPEGAVSGHYLPGDGRWTESAANAYLALNCFAGNQAMLAAYRQVSGDPAANGCGCETAFGCRADAQHALAIVNAQLNRAMPAVSSAPIPSNPGSTNGATIPVNVGNGITYNAPVPVSSLFNAQIGGVPVLAIALGLGVLAFAGGRRGRA